MLDTTTVRAYIGLGSNLHDPHAQLERAFAALAALPRSLLRAHSGVYRSAPLDGSDQPDYLNAVAALDTSLTPRALLDALHDIERAQGRERRMRWAARTLDLDLLLYGDAILAEPGLRVPHPGLSRRSFVLYPLYELDAGLMVPGFGLLRSLLAACPAHALERIGDA